MSVKQGTRLRVLRGAEAVPEGARGGVAMLTLMRVATRWTRVLAAVAERHGLTLAQVEVLLCLHGGEGITQQELAERLLVTKGNVCVTVQRMEAAGLIDRRPDPLDQRAHRLFLTEAGRRQLAAIRPDHRVALDRILKGLDGDEQGALYRMLIRLEQALDDLEQGS
jgi:DNA-binding MarR family transcriptional regulator